MRKQATGNFEEDDVIDGEGLKRGKVKKKDRVNDSVKQVVNGLNEVKVEVDEFRRIINREGRPQIEVLEDERVLDDNAGFGETARYYYENVKDKTKSAWDEVARPFRESKQMKKELKAQEDVVKRKMSVVRKDAHTALGVIALESRLEIEEMNRFNELKEAEYRLIEQQRDKELKEDIRKHEREMEEINERFEKERKDRKRAAKKQTIQVKKAVNKTDDFYKQSSRFHSAHSVSMNMNRFSMQCRFQGEGFFAGVSDLEEPVEEKIDVNAEMKALIEVMKRSKLEEFTGNKRIIFRDHEDAIEFCGVFNRVVYPLGISDYKFSDFNSGMGELPDYYSANIDDKELEIVESFMRKDPDIDVADVVKRV